MDGVPYFISLDEALGIVTAGSPEIKDEVVTLDEAHGRILARDLMSMVDDPPFDNSAMDGFACAHEVEAVYPHKMTTSVPWRLRKTTGPSGFKPDKLFES